MAAIFEQISATSDGPRTEFSGSTEHDIEVAKTFWRSVQLLPPLESRLISADIAQRLKIASPGHSNVTRLYPTQPTDDPVTQHYNRIFYEKAQHDKKQQLRQMQARKHEVKSLFVKHQEIRKKKDSISRPFRPPASPPPPSVIQDKMAGDF